MPIVVKSAGTFTPAPEGAHAAICVDVVDLGVMAVTYAGATKEQHKVEIIWQIDEARNDGKPFSVKKRYTLSLHEKAALRKDLESWRGRPFSDAECQGFDLEDLIGQGCMLNVVHNVTGSATFANVAAIMRLPKNTHPPTPRDYVRVIERTAAQQEPDAQPFGQITDDDIPF